MTITVNSFLKRGYIPLACNRYAGIAWQGEYLQDFWMWNGQFTEYNNGVKHIQTVRANDLKDAALRFWRDGWVPLKPVDESFLRRMERALREHQGLKKEGVKFPGEDFLRMPDRIPERFLGPEARAYLGKSKVKKRKLTRKEELSDEVLESIRKARGGR